MATSKLSSKAAKLDFSNLPGALPPAGRETPPETAGVVATPASTPSPKTAPGALMAFANDARSSLMRENDALRQQAGEAATLRGKLDEALNDLQQWDGAKAARLIEPLHIVRSRYANRHELNFGGAEFEQLRNEIAHAGGNVQPIKVRRVGSDGQGAARYEIVFGHRRHQACLELGLPVLAVVDNLDDRALFVEMDRENRARKDLSAWEQGLMYQRALDEGLFPSNRKLAEAVGVDVGNLGRALALARLPALVVEAFPSPLELQFRWSKLLSDACTADPDAVLTRARVLIQERGKWSAKQVLARLLGDEEPYRRRGLYGTTPLESPLDVTVAGRSVATLRTDPDGDISIQISSGVVPADRIQALAEHLRSFLAQV